eukprot:2273686-Rhodomonas_salina.1
MEWRGFVGGGGWRKAGRAISLANSSNFGARDGRPASCSLANIHDPFQYVRRLQAQVKMHLRVSSPDTSFEVWMDLHNTVRSANLSGWTFTTQIGKPVQAQAKNGARLSQHGGELLGIKPRIAMIVHGIDIVPCVPR